MTSLKTGIIIEGIVKWRGLNRLKTRMDHCMFQQQFVAEFSFVYSIVFIGLNTHIYVPTAVFIFVAELALLVNLPNR